MLKTSIFKEILSFYQTREPIVISLPKKEEIDINYRLAENRTILMFACSNGDLEVVKDLIKKGAKMDLIENTYGNSALFFALCFKHYHIAKYLIDNGANVNIINLDNENVLFGTVDYNNIELTELLCKKGININVCNKQSYYPIFGALANNNTDILKILIKYGADLELKEKIFGDTPLLYSIKNPENAKILIEAGVNIHAQNNLQDTAVNIATLLEKLEIVKILKEKGADMNHQNSQRNNPIIFAVGNGYPEIVDYLLDCDVDLNVIDICKESLLNICIYQDRLEIMDKLLNKDKNLVHRKFHTCRWPLFVAAKRNKYYYADLLLRHGANPNPELLLEHSPLFVAFENKNYKIVELLITYGVSKIHLMNAYIHFHKYHELVHLINTNRYLLNEIDGNFRTPLFNAVYANDFEIVKFLLEKGCNPNIHGGSTSPLIISIYTHNTDIIEVLIKYGAINNSVEVLDCARRTFNKKVQKIFTNLGFVL